MNYYRVVIDSRSSFLQGGLTYASLAPIAIGSLVLVPLRKSTAEGIVIAEDGLQGEGIREIMEVLSSRPLLSTAHCKLLSWMCSYYLAPPRSVLKVLLPSPPWHLLCKRTEIATLTMSTENKVRGKHQQALLALLQEGPMKVPSLLAMTDAPRSALKKLIERKLVALSMEEQDASPKQKICSIPTTIPTSFADDILSSPQPVLVLHDARSEEEEIIAEVSSACLREGRSSLILTPDIAHAAILQEKLTSLFGHAFLLHSNQPESQQREIWRELSQSTHPTIVIGTRIALFAPISDLGAIIVLSEHDWRWKNEQTPHYHARLTAEILSKLSGAKLVLCSPCPSLETLHHARSLEGNAPRYRIVQHRTTSERKLPQVRLVDLGDIRFEGLFPLTYPLIEELKAQKTRGKKSVLILNKLGMGSSLLCTDCRTTVSDPVTRLPLILTKREGKTMLLSRQTDTVFPVPITCAHCRGTNLRQVGAGTQKVEELLEAHLPNLRVLRCDRETKEVNEESTENSLRDIDVVIGTQTAIKHLSHPESTFGAILLADLGLSIPAIRSSELVYQRIREVVAEITKSMPTTLLVQTFRPQDPAIACAVTGEREKFALQELALRSEAKYPPFVQAIRLIFRGIHGKERALTAMEKAKRLSLQAWLSGQNKNNIWHVTLTGESRRVRQTAQELLPLCSAVDIDPLDL